MEPGNGPRLLLLEFRARDLFSQHRLDMYPFFQGAAREAGLPVSWRFLGFDPERQQDSTLTLSLPEDQLARLEETIAGCMASHVVLNERLDERIGRRLRERFPRLAWRQAEFSDARLTCGQFLGWLGLPAGPAPGGMLADRAPPVFDCAPLDPGAEPGERLLQILGGPSCLYARRVTTAPAFRGLSLDECTGRVHGCSFCGRNPEELRYPYRTPALELTLAQIEAAGQARGGWSLPARYLVDGAGIYPRADRFFRRILDSGIPPSEFHFACRADEFLRHAPKLEGVLAEVARAGHSVHFSNMGVENFSPAENERLNKGISQADIAGVMETLARWEQRWPGAIGFDRHGGFGFILFTPWTTLEDLRANARALRELRLGNVGFCLTTRLVLLPGRPISLLAAREGLTAAEFEDPLMADFCRAGCLTEWGQREEPWRFKLPVVGLIHAILLRRVPEAVAGREDEQARLVAEAVRALPEGSRDWLPFLELLVEAARSNPGATGVAELLGGLPPHGRRAPAEGRGGGTRAGRRPAPAPASRDPESELPPVPERIDVKVGFACNNRCRFCVQGRKRERYGRRSFEELAAFLAEGRKRNTGVVFTGGEPALHPDLVRLAARARELGYTSIQVQSNGRMFAYARFCRELVAAGVTEFSPALHGHRADCHDYLTTVAGSFEQTVQGIRNLKALGQRVITNSVITRSNYRHLANLARLLVELGVDQFQLAFVHPVGSAGPEANFAAIVPRFQLIAEHVHAGLEIGDAAGRRCMTEAIPICFMKGYERFIGERIMPPTRIYDAEGVIPDYRDYRLQEGKLKGPPCTRCEASGACEGPWREYPERYGWGEFSPITEK